MQDTSLTLFGREQRIATSITHGERLWEVLLHGIICFTTGQSVLYVLYELLQAISDIK